MSENGQNLSKGAKSLRKTLLKYDKRGFAIN